MNNSNKDFDLIIGGAGAAGLSLAYRLASNDFSHMKVLLIEPTSKDSNDRTWCSWVKGPAIFDNCAQASFSKVKFLSDSYKEEVEIAPYRYRVIDSLTFYKFVYQEIEKSSNITILRESIVTYHEFTDRVDVEVQSGKVYSGNIFFKCFLDDHINKASVLYVDQHFKGWVIETAENRFDTNSCTFMDFTIEQNEEVRFMYVIPLSPTKALVEVAIFSNSVLENENYNQIITRYITHDLEIEAYTILHEEFGIIPMTDYDFIRNNTKKVIHLGSSGGAIKPSTGYAFMRIQEQCDYVLKCIEKGASIEMKSIYSIRHKLYDQTFLDVILNKRMTGEAVFSSLFEKNSPQKLFKFLDEKTSIWEEIALMRSCDIQHFGKAFLKQIFK